MDLVDRLQTLADLVPVLESAEADFGHWETPPPVDGMYRLPYYEFGPTADAFTSAVARGGWMVIGFDWGAWLATDQGRAISEQPEALASADADQLAWLLTAIIRSDRFTEGSIAGAFESGLLARIAHRAASLIAESERASP